MTRSANAEASYPQEAGDLYQKLDRYVRAMETLVQNSADSRSGALVIQVRQASEGCVRQIKEDLVRRRQALSGT